MAKGFSKGLGGLTGYYQRHMEQSKPSQTGKLPMLLEHRPGEEPKARIRKIRAKVELETSDTIIFLSDRSAEHEKEHDQTPEETPEGAAAGPAFADQQREVEASAETDAQGEAADTLLETPAEAAKPAKVIQDIVDDLDVEPPLQLHPNDAPWTLPEPPAKGDDVKAAMALISGVVKSPVPKAKAAKPKGASRTGKSKDVPYLERPGVVYPVWKGFAKDADATP